MPSQLPRQLISVASHAARQLVLVAVQASVQRPQFARQVTRCGAGIVLQLAKHAERLGQRDRQVPRLVLQVSRHAVPGMSQPC